MNFKKGEVVRGDGVHDGAWHCALIGLAESGAKRVAVKGAWERWRGGGPHHSAIFVLKEYRVKQMIRFKADEKDGEEGACGRG